MKLRIYKTNNRYAFTVDGFSSVHHAHFIPDIEPTYQYAWQAHKTAKSLAFDKGFHVEAIRNKKYAIEDLTEPVLSDEPAEETLINHYKHMLVEMSRKVEGIDDNAPEEKEMTYLMIKSQVDDLLRIQDGIEDDKYKPEIDKIINEYRRMVQNHFKSYLEKDKEQAEAVQQAQDIQPEIPNMPPVEEGQPMEPNLTMACNKNRIQLTEEELMELLDHYGGRVCSAIASRHPDAIYKINLKDSSFDIICIDQKMSKPILKITVNGNFNVNNIIPMNGLSEMYPSFSPKFYQRYWKPIVESLGHFFLDEIDSLIIPELGALPDMSEENANFDMRGWNPKELKEIPLSMSFNNEVEPMWAIAASQPIKKIATEYTEEDFLRTQPTRVRCIDQKLQLFGNIGEVVQIIPINAGIGFELDVNFGRKIVRLSKHQVEIVDDI